MTTGIPFAMVFGNHDNTGTQNASFPGRESQGHDNSGFYDDAFWNGLESAFSAWNYDHLAESKLAGGGAEGDSHAWLTDVGGQQPRVLLCDNASQGAFPVPVLVIPLAGGVVFCHV